MENLQVVGAHRRYVMVAGSILFMVAGYMAMTGRQGVIGFGLSLGCAVAAWRMGSPSEAAVEIQDDAQELEALRRETAAMQLGSGQMQAPLPPPPMAGSMGTKIHLRSRLRATVSWELYIQ